MPEVNAWCSSVSHFLFVTAHVLNMAFLLYHFFRNSSIIKSSYEFHNMFLWWDSGLKYFVLNSKAVISARRRILWVVKLSETEDICRDGSDLFIRLPEIWDSCDGWETEATERTGS